MQSDFYAVFKHTAHSFATFFASFSHLMYSLIPSFLYFLFPPPPAVLSLFLPKQ